MTEQKYTPEKPDNKPLVKETPVVKEVVKEKKAGESEAAEVLEKFQKILAEHGGLEGNIPAGSEYWDLMNQYRALVNKK